MDPNVSAVVLLVGLAVGVDYSLFYLKREREERARAGPRAALEAAAATSGRSVLISGLTVIVAMAGMLFAGDKTYLSFGVGDDDRRRRRDARLADRAAGAALAARRQGREGAGSRSSTGSAARAARTASGRRSSTPVLRHPVVGRRRLGRRAGRARPAGAPHPHRADRARRPAEEHRHRPDARQDPGGVPRRRHAGARRDQGARGLAGGEGRRRPQLEGAGARDRPDDRPIAVDVSDDGTTTRVAIPLEGNGTDSTSLAGARTRSGTSSCRRRSARCRTRRTRSAAPTAATADENSLLKHSPRSCSASCSAGVPAAAVAFRSIVIPIKAIVLNLLSVAAAYGVLVVVFQRAGARRSWASSSNGGIASWLPIFLFVILFGLSMDYHVFILSRIREAFDRGHDDRGRGRARNQDHGGRRHERRGRDGRRVRDLRDAPDPRHEGARASAWRRPS